MYYMDIELHKLDRHLYRSFQREHTSQKVLLALQQMGMVTRPLSFSNGISLPFSPSSPRKLSSLTSRKRNVSGCSRHNGTFNSSLKNCSNFNCQKKKHK